MKKKANRLLIIRVIIRETKENPKKILFRTRITGKPVQRAPLAMVNAGLERVPFAHFIFILIDMINQSNEGKKRNRNEKTDPKRFE